MKAFVRLALAAGSLALASPATAATRTETKPAGAKPAAAPAPDAQMKKILDRLATLGGKPTETLTADEARKQPTPADAVKAVLTDEGKSTEPEKVAKVENRTIPGPAGEIPIRVYTPEGKGPFPVVVYFHGGGWVIANLDVYDATPRALANKTSAVIVSVEYRQAPENKFPAAHEDSFAAYEWTLKNAASIGGDPARIAVAGESAGGNLAAAVSMMARDKKVKLPVHELLVYPIAAHDFETPSYKTNVDAKPLNRAMMKWFFENALTDEKDAKDPRISLVSANLKGLPPTTIVAAEIDPLLSEGKMLADKLAAAGVRVEYRRYDGVTHEFFGMAAAVDKAKDAQEFAAKGLQRGFAKSRAAR